jgi:predicted secreted hydrolase
MGPNKGAYGYQLTFFRTGMKRETVRAKSKWSIRDLYFAHLAITDEAEKRFEYREKISRGSLGEAGAHPYSSDGKPFRVWVEDWSIEGKGSAAQAKQDHILKGGDNRFGLELILTPEKYPVIHGRHGISRKAEGDGFASHYYSITRLKTSGRIFLKGKPLSVRGTSWMDHEFGSNQLQEHQVGWDWFSLQLENGMDLMFYLIRDKDGTPDPSSSGTIIFADGAHQHLPLKDFQIEVLKKWKSRKSGAQYPSKWRVLVPAHGIELILVPTVEDQELATEASTRVTYWEGSARAEGKIAVTPVRGRAYVELTGYAKPFTKGI